ncbi:hypothetical protein [Vibrio parahaemolyticus]|uniref:hypothetical protein n=1 Tax=Vibrio parahaemolyticus TaxID=670 RepID=UPI00226B5254|nr:hypothetical protein [Vibrio parahaemolyticus]MCX8941239.1 hypothetical protein [Vibrio parahaemolyticus]
MKDTAYFISRAKAVHGDLYDYSKSKYINAKEPLTIICDIHGEFTQKPMNHYAGKGCKQCGAESKSGNYPRLTTRKKRVTKAKVKIVKPTKTQRGKLIVFVKTAKPAKPKYSNPLIDLVFH